MVQCSTAFDEGILHCLGSGTGSEAQFSIRIFGQWLLMRRRADVRPRLPGLWGSAGQYRVCARKLLRRRADIHLRRPMLGEAHLNIRICAQWLLRRRPMLGEAHLPPPARVLLNPISGLGHQRWISTRLLKSDGAHTWISARLLRSHGAQTRISSCASPRPWAPEVHIGTPPQKPWAEDPNIEARFPSALVGHLRWMS